MPVPTSAHPVNDNQALISRKDVLSQNFFGESHAELAIWLSQTWLKEGPPICIIQGFSGVGKTSLARNLMKNLDCPRVTVTMPDVESNQVNDLFLDLATELSLIGINEMAYAVDDGTSLSSALERVLRKQILIVVDEFQQALDELGRPINRLAYILDRIVNRPHFPGRMLLLSNRIVERSKWSEAYAIRTLSALEPEEAELLLDARLRETSRNQEVPFERRRDVVNWLGCNPRAIQVLVGSLEQDSLDDLIGLSPENWELRERAVAPELLHRLERELLERTLSHLKVETNKVLHRLSVHRKPVKRKAIEMLLPARVEFADVRGDLISRFLAEQHSGWFTLNPIVKEISLQRLKDNLAELRLAHSKAADYYTRHFTAKNIVVSGQLGGYFVEARYHLVQAKREKDLSGIAELFGNHLRASFKQDSSIPEEQDELDEKIAVLSALLETTGDRRLEYNLAKLYQARGTSNDLQKALIYAKRATGVGALTAGWLLRIRLEEQLNGLQQALQVCLESIERIPLEERYIDFYWGCAELLAQAGKREEAIKLLKESIERLPPEHNLVELYRSSGLLLIQADRVEEAIKLLKESIERLPVDKGSLQP